MMKRRHLAFAFACSALVAAAPISAQPVRSTAELIDEMSNAARKGDEQGKLTVLIKVAKAVAADPSYTTLQRLVLQAEMQREISRAIHMLGADNPCPALDQGVAFLVQARAALSPDERNEDTEALDDMEQRFASESSRMRCSQPMPPVEVGKPDTALVGHYYLSGVMETGSELLLKADGRFDWYMSYGSVDQIAKGRWGRSGETVTLFADLPSADAPLFRADEVFPWDEAAEREQREYERSEQVESIAARCPWNAAATSALWSYDLENPKVASEAQLAKASEAKRIAEAARDEASRIFAKAAMASANDDARAAADAAMSAYHAAHSEMAQAFHDAGLPEPDIGYPAVPAECQLPADESYRQIPESEWRRGVGVVVGDPAREMRLSRVDVTFVFGDGHRETTKTRRGGFAFAPVRKGTAVEQIVVALSEPFSRSETLSIKPLTEGLQAVIVDTQQLVEPAFSVMRFAVEGADLIPQDMPRGRYSRN